MPQNQKNTKCIVYIAEPAYQQCRYLQSSYKSNCENTSHDGLDRYSNHQLNQTEGPACQPVPSPLLTKAESGFVTTNLKLPQQHHLDNEQTPYSMPVVEHLPPIQGLPLDSRVLHL